MLEWLAIAVLAALTGSCVYVPARLLGGLRRHVRQGPPRGQAALPPALVILPCKASVDERKELEANLAPVLDQDYPQYRVIFALGDAEDPARAVVEPLVARQPDRAQLVVAEPLPGCSRKISNQLRALAEVREDEQVYVFLDADARPDRGLLRRLVEPLSSRDIGVTTGFRWYRPAAGAPWASWLRAAWNAAGLGMLTDPNCGYAWGGAMAIRRDVFETCGVAAYWRQALSDDLGLTDAVRQAGHGIYFVPQALVESPEDLGLRQVIEWTNRQTVICRVYHPRMWRDVFIGEALTLAVVLAWIAVGVAGFVTGSVAWATLGLIGLTLVLGGRIGYELGIVRAVQRVRPELVDRTLRFRLAVMAPLITPLLVLNSLRSWLSTSICWRGVRYRLLSPRHIEVEAASAAS